LKTWLIAYVATLVVFLAIDAVWLGVVAVSLYRDAIGHLMLDQPNFVAAGIFYAIYVVGILVFAVMPALAGGQWTDALIKGALFGFFAYLTYDMTNLATLKGWPVWIAIVDTAWGTLLTGAAATGGFLITRWMGGAAAG
jgi:uncharacterized membrane protein